MPPCAFFLIHAGKRDHRDLAHQCRRSMDLTACAVLAISRDLRHIGASWLIIILPSPLRNLLPLASQCGQAHQGQEAVVQGSNYAGSGECPI